MSKSLTALGWVLRTGNCGAHLTDKETEAVPATSLSASTEPMAEREPPHRVPLPTPTHSHF